MDFYKISTRTTKSGVEIFPDFLVNRSTDLMVRGNSFYAIWDEEKGLWSTDEYDVQRLVDADLKACFEKADSTVKNVRYLVSLENGMWMKYRSLVKNTSDSYHPLDTKLVFANQKTKKTDYVSKRLPYSLEDGDHSAWDELVSYLYNDEERAKIEWAIGAVVSGDARKIQKFLVLYGSAGTGKSTILNIISKLFEGYTVTFDAKSLGSSSGTFSTEVFKSNPLVAIQHDGDLSKIEDNTKLNSVISHEDMTMNEKFKPTYSSKVNAFLFMGTNQPVKISDAKSGIIRRLIDVSPSGNTLKFNHYKALMARIDFELGAIAQHCLGVYQSMGKNAYDAYRPVSMMFQTDPFFNFVEAHFDVFKKQNGTTLKQAYTLYKEYCSDSGLKHFPQYKIREELRNYFDEFHDRIVIDDEAYRSYYKGFSFNKVKSHVEDTSYSLVLEDTISEFDSEFETWPAQYASQMETPKTSWSSVTTTLSDLDTSQLHYVKVPLNHIVIDFDIKDENGEKSLERNVAAASEWPPTYAEFSKSGAGIHLHYWFDGDVETLRQDFAPGIEVKHFPGNSSLRRKLSRCNSTPIATLRGGLPLKEKKKMLDTATMQSERGLRALIERNLKKEIHPGTKPSIDFIKKILDDAYNDNMAYDVTDLRHQIIAFANNSSHQAMTCLKTVQQMKFQGPDGAASSEPTTDEHRIVFFDVEVYPNLFVLCWKYEGETDVVRMINPKPHEVEALFKFKLVGFNNRRYDNHILWAAYMGYDNDGLYKVSQKLIDNDRNGTFGEAYRISYADIYDFSSKKQGLKKFEIELGLMHVEMDLPWDEPVPENQWTRVADYCANDVVATEATFNSRAQDFAARQILAKLSGLTVNDTTQKHTAKIIFGNDKDAQAKFVYTDLSEMFPGYVFDLGKSTYRGEDVGEGGYVYAEPGMYENVVLLDVASMHPTSIELLDMFGPYTENFSALKKARIAIKHKDYEAAGEMLGGVLKPYLGSTEDAEALSYALKIVINIVYGLTSAKFDNPFRDTRNKDNICAKRGALFMIDLKYAVQELGYTVAHIKTDSIKIPNADQKVIDFVMKFGEKYGYDFELEGYYDKFCLVNDAVYIAKKQECINPPKWDAVGAQFQHPYVFKTLFSHEEVMFDDLCETKQVTQGSMYLDYESVSSPMGLGKEGVHFVGRTGQFVPVTEESGGGILWRIKDDKRYAVTGTKGYLWLEAPVVQSNRDMVEIDMSYFETLVYDARENLAKFGDVKAFLA